MFNTLKANNDSVFASSANNEVTENQTFFKDNLAILGSVLNRESINCEIPKSEFSPIINLAQAKIKESDRNALAFAVNSSLNASNIQASIARSYAEMKTSESEISAMASAIEELTASISQIANLAKDTDVSLEAAAAKSSQGAQEVVGAAKSSESVNEALNLVDTDLKNLSEATGDIRGMAQEIENIASQTNLLALNATIEAARAGEAGRGFAVVAQEVKQLSSQTAKSTETIRVRIGRLEEALNSIIDAINTAKSAASEATSAAHMAANSVSEASSEVAQGAHGVANVAHVLGEQKMAVDELTQSASRAANSASGAMDLINEAVGVVAESENSVNQQFAILEQANVDNYVLYRAKSDHLLWKKRLAGLISGMSSLNESELTDHNSCRLGKWWNNMKVERADLSNAFYAIEAPHKLVHEYGKEAARLFNNGDRHGALESFFKMDEASKVVVQKLDELIAEVERK